MTDNVAITQGSGTTVAADDVGGVLHQRVKISQGADGSATDVSSAAPLQVTLANTGANINKVLVTPDLPSGASTAANQTTGNTSLSSIDGKITAVNTGAVVVSSSALPTGAATAAKQPALGTAGAASTDVITVQGKAAMTPLLVDPSGVTSPVSLASVPSHPVTNAGTFQVQSTLDAETTKVIGTVRVASGGIASGSVASGAVASGAFASGSIASGALASGSIAAGAIAAGATSIADNEDVASADGDRGVKTLAVRKATPANTSGTDGDYEFLQMSAGRLWASTNVDQINGITPLMGNGATGTGALRVSVASDSTGQTTLTDGTQIANTFAGDSGQNTLLTAGGRKDSGAQALSTSNYGAIDVSNYSWVTVQCTAYTSGTLTWQCSNDNSTWVGLPLTQANALVTTASGNNLTATATGMWHGPLTARYFRVTGGVATIYVSFYSQPRGSLYVSALMSGTTSTIQLNGTTNTVRGGKTNNNAAPSTDNLGVYPAIANAAQQSWTEGNLVTTSVNLKGSQRSVIQDAALNDRGANVNAANELLVIDQGFRPAATALNTYSARVSTNTTTTPTSSTAYVSSIAISVETAGTTSTLDIRDKQGTPVYLVRTLSTASLLGNGDIVYNFQTPIKMTSGIDVITAGAGAATVGVFINYYQ